LINRQPTGERWIIAATGYSQNSVRAALCHLAEVQLVARNGGHESWVLTDGAYQLPLELDMVTVPKSQNLTLSSTTTTANNIVDIQKEAAAESKNESQKLTLAANLQALHSAGIMGKTAENLARLPHINPEYITFHVAKAHREGRPTGILICRLRDGDPAKQPESSSNPYLSGDFAQYINH
jgi:hypothetical protein